MKKIKQKIADFLYKHKYETLITLVTFVVVFWDLVFKAITDGKNFTLIPNVLGFNYSHNTGAAWSIMSNLTWLLILISIIFIIAICVANYFYKNKSYFYAVSVGLILSGAIGNLIDRIFFGYVRDFIDLEFMNFPTFNIADIAITVGVILLCVYILFLSKKQKNATEPSAEVIAQTNLIENSESIEQTEPQNQEQSSNADAKDITKDELKPVEKSTKTKKTTSTKSNKTTSKKSGKTTTKKSNSTKSKTNSGKKTTGKTQTKKSNVSSKAKTNTNKPKSSSNKKQGNQNAQ